MTNRTEVGGGVIMPNKFNGHFATPPEYIRMQSRFIGVIGMVFSYGAMLSVSDKSVSGNKPPK